MGGARLLPAPQAGVHDVLYDTLSGIYRGTLDHSGLAELCGAAALTADMHYTAAHHFDPNRAVFGEFEPFWEFVSGPLHAGTDARPAKILSQQF
jgi:hypothetical protein